MRSQWNNFLRSVAQAPSVREGGHGIERIVLAKSDAMNCFA